jgi:hypothetical protein
MQHPINIELEFHQDATPEQRDSDIAYLNEKLNEFVDEASAVKSYKVLGDDDIIYGQPFDTEGFDVDATFQPFVTRTNVGYRIRSGLTGKTYTVWANPSTSGDAGDPDIFLYRTAGPDFFSDGDMLLWFHALPSEKVDPAPFQPTLTKTNDMLLWSNLPAVEQPTVTITFVPQVWTGPDRDYAMNVDPIGAHQWEVPVTRVAGIKPRTHEADSLASEPEAPPWVQQWALIHPFEVEWDEELVTQG